MNTTWTLHEAKNKFSEVVNRALSDGPQIIMRRNQETAVLVSINLFQSLSSNTGDLADFFKHSPLADVELDLERTDDFGREVDL